MLIAGGIGITPFLAQLEDLHDGAVPYELHYSVRSPEHAAFLGRLRAREGDRAHMYYDSESHVIDFDGLLSHQPLGTHVYVCGPAGLINRVINTAKNCGWPGSHIHWEQFSAPPVGDAFEVFLARCNLTVRVPAGPKPDGKHRGGGRRSALSVPRRRLRLLPDQGVSNCDGELLHNDHFLSDAEQGEGQIASCPACRARAASSLVLDL